MSIQIRKYLRRDLLRPAVYMTFTRFLLALTAALLFDHFASSAARPLRAYAFLFMGVFFFALAWIAYLRLDGIKLPRLMMLRLNIRKKPARTYGDMSDYTDEKIVSFDDLENDEKDVCCLTADLFCFVVFMLLSCI